MRYTIVAEERVLDEDATVACLSYRRWWWPFTRVERQALLVRGDWFWCDNGQPVFRWSFEAAELSNQLSMLRLLGHIERERLAEADRIIAEHDCEERRLRVVKGGRP